MDTARLGSSMRVLRERRGWRQLDLAAASGCSASLVSRVERGRLANVPVGKLVRLADALGARADLRLLWQGERLDRLLDVAHAAAVEESCRLLTRKGWQVAPEVSFSVYGERGGIDVLAFHPATAVLLVVEVKSSVPDVQSTLAILDRKARLAVGIARQRG